MGNTDVLQPSTAGGAHQRTGGRERQPHVLGQRQAQVRGAAAQLPARDVRDHGRVLETQRFGPAKVLRDTPVPAAEEPRVRAGRMNRRSSRGNSPVRIRTNRFFQLNRNPRTEKRTLCVLVAVRLFYVLYRISGAKNSTKHMLYNL